jgi:hypothetical protein
MDAEHLVAIARAPLKDMLEDLPLQIEGVIVPRTRVDADFSYIPRFRQILVPERDFGLPLVNELRVKAQRGPDKSSPFRDLTIARPRFGCGRHRKRVDTRLLRLFDRRDEVGVEVEMTVKIDVV